jgi:putative oxidoreductase
MGNRRIAYGEGTIGMGRTAQFLARLRIFTWHRLVLGGLLARLVLGGLFVYASIDKILHPDQFAEIIYNYKILPDMAVNLMAIGLPWVEAIAGLFLIFGIWTRESAGIIGGLLLVFIIAIAFNLARGLDFDCGCFTTAAGSTKSSAYLLLVRDLVLLIPAAQLIWFVPLRRRFVASDTSSLAAEVGS